MSKSQKKLIIITGSPCVGKTTVAEQLFESYENSAFFDGDWAWCVHPFSLTDPRLRNGDKTASFALSVYLNSGFDYVFFPLWLQWIRAFVRQYWRISPQGITR